VSEAFTGTHLGMWRILGPEGSNELPGLLSCDEPGVVTLELSVSYEQFLKQLVNAPAEYSPTVVGADNRGTEYSIFDCRVTSGHVAAGKSAPFCAIKLRSKRIIAARSNGELQTDSFDKLQFSTVLLRSPRLADWWHVPGSDTQRNEGTITEIQHTPAPVDLAVWGDISVQLACQPNVRRSSYQHFQGKTQPMGVDPDIYLSMTSVSDHPLQDYMRLLEMVCTFASIVLQTTIDTPAITAYSNSYTVTSESSTPTPLPVEVLWPLRGCKMHRTGDATQRLLDVKSQADLIVHMLGKWHDNYEYLEPNARPLLNSSQQLDLPQPERFLSSVSALEGLHRVVHPEPRWPTEQWQRKVSSVINTSASKKDREWARGYLKNSNEPNLPMRLTRFCDDSSAFFTCHNGSAFFGPDKINRTDFVNKTVNLRNKFAHSLPQPASVQEDVRRLNVYTRECDALLLVSLFKYLGWTEADATVGGRWPTSEWSSTCSAFRSAEHRDSDLGETVQRNTIHRQKHTSAEIPPQ